MSFLHVLLLSLNIFLTISGHPIDFPEDDLIERSLWLQNELETFEDVQPSEYRLNTSVKPSHYKIELEPFFDEPQKDAFTFDGNVVITLRAQMAGVKDIELHADDLTIKKVSLQYNNNTEISTVTSYQNATHKLKVSVADALNHDIDYKLEIDYAGKLNDDMHGFYRSYYNEDGRKVWLASTQFQQTAARRAFPCFDEPSFKAVFELTIIRPIGYQKTISNTKLNNTRVDPETTKVIEIFNPTPKMSSYLMAFVVQMFNGKQNADESYGVWARPEAESQLTYALGVGEKLLKQMGTWVNYPFNEVDEIEKLDMIAVPDFSAGAMENWGAMTYRETALLWDEKESSANNKQRIAAVLTHEIAHLWFGDLVTCDWWSTTWLNEGFARYFQYFGTHLVEKNWDLPAQFVVEQVQGVFGMDSLTSTHPMTNPEVYTPGQASGMFSSISYNKGGSVIRMIEHHMGTTNFQKALQKYLRDNQYQAVLPDKLFAQFDAVTPKVSETFLAWTTQSGYPVLTVTSHVNDTIKVNQKRFLLNDKDHNDTTRWSIPITYANRPEHFTQTTTRAIYPSTQITDFSLNLPANGTLGFYILNVQEVGYYRVNYNKENWEAISKALRTTDHGKIPNINRAQIVDDLLNFARAGVVTYDFAMGIVDYVSTETNYIPWLSTFNGLTHLSKRIGHGGDYERFRKHILYLTENLYKHLGFEPKANETHIDTLSRTNLLNWICKHGHEECISKAKEEFQKFRTVANHTVNPNIRIPVYCTAIREGTEEEFNFLWNKYKTTNVAAEEINILTALGCAKTQALVDSFLNKTLSDDVRPQDKSSSFTNSYVNNHENVDLVFNYLTKYYKEWEKVMGSVGSALSSLSDRFTTEEQVKKLEDFGKTSGLGENNVKTITNAVASARKNLEWDKERLVEVRNYFKQLDDSGNSASNISFSISLVLLSIVTFFYLN